MLVATILWACSEVVKLRNSVRAEPARTLYTAALAFAIVHVLVAFDLVYAWSQDAAIEATARQTAEVVGIRWGGGIFVNYLFLALWGADVWHWWVSPGPHEQRSTRLEGLRLVFFLFMFINGAIIFAGPVARLVGIPAAAAVMTAWLLSARKRRARA